MCRFPCTLQHSMAHEKTIHIRLLTSVVGDGFSYPQGTEQHAPEHIATDLIRTGHAAPVATLPDQRAEKQATQAAQAEKRRSK